MYHLPLIDNEEGVSALISFTENGRQVICDLNDVTPVMHPFKVVTEGQIKKNAKTRELRQFFINYLRVGLPLDGALFKLLMFSQIIVVKLHSIFLNK